MSLALNPRLGPSGDVLLQGADADRPEAGVPADPEAQGLTRSRPSARAAPWPSWR